MTDLASRLENRVQLNAALEIDNPYWVEVRGILSIYNGEVCAGNILGSDEDREAFMRRHDLVGLYSWSIPDPATLQFVLERCNGAVIDPLAGSGYWSYLLGQLGVDVVSYDRAPGKSRWHDSKLWVPITEMEGVDSVRLHPDRTLLLSWPPYSTSDGYDVLKAYEGNRVIYIGENEGGCCGDDMMAEELEQNWQEEAYHRPVQWSAIHDYVTVYRRRHEA